MRLLLTSAGIKNPSIHEALLDLLGKPIAESTALAVPTAGYGHPHVTPTGAYKFLTGQSSTPMSELGWQSIGVLELTGQSSTPMSELGWQSIGVLELTALPSIDRSRWESWVREADVLLVNGGDALYLAHWMRESGLAELLPTLENIVWVGLS